MSERKAAEKQEDQSKLTESPDTESQCDSCRDLTLLKRKKEKEKKKDKERGNKGHFFEN